MGTLPLGKRDKEKKNSYFLQGKMDNYTGYGGTESCIETVTGTTVGGEGVWGGGP